jgi:hypothetical protein
MLPIRMRAKQRRQSSFTPLPANGETVVDLALDLCDASKRSRTVMAQLNPSPHATA